MDMDPARRIIPEGAQQRAKTGGCRPPLRPYYLSVKIWIWVVPDKVVAYGGSCAMIAGPLRVHPSEFHHEAPTSRSCFRRGRIAHDPPGAARRSPERHVRDVTAPARRLL